MLATNSLTDNTSWNVTNKLIRRPANIHVTIEPNITMGRPPNPQCQQAQTGTATPDDTDHRELAHASRATSGKDTLLKRVATLAPTRSFCPLVSNPFSFTKPLLLPHIILPEHKTVVETGSRLVKNDLALVVRNWCVYWTGRMSQLQLGGAFSLGLGHMPLLVTTMDRNSQKGNQRRHDSFESSRQASGWANIKHTPAPDCRPRGVQWKAGVETS